MAKKAVTSFLRPSTTHDVEVFFNGAILMKKHMDRDANRSVEYCVALFDKKPDGVSYKVDSNAIGLEALRLLSRKHKIKNGGSQSAKSKYIGYCQNVE